MTETAASDRGLIGVTGATGALGGRVARRLADAGVPQRLVVRDGSRAPDLAGAHVATVAGGYRDAAGLRDSLDGVETLFLVSATEDADRMSLHRSSVDAAVAAGVSRIVYTSFLGASAHCTFTFGRDHFHTEEYIRATGVAHTFLRDSLYVDVLPYWAGTDGVVRGPAGDGRFAPVTRDDVADVAAVVLTGGGYDGRSLDLTGPESITMAEVAAELTAASGRLITYDAETLDQAYASRAVYDAPEWMVAGWVTTYSAIALGELDVVSTTVADVTGHQPLSLRDYLARYPDEVARLR